MQINIMFVKDKRSDAVWNKASWHDNYRHNNCDVYRRGFLGAALAMAKGFVSSGAGEKVIQFLMNNFSNIVINPVALVTIFLITGFVLSQFMSNGSLVSMLAAIGVPLALQIGCNPMPVALACVYGCSLAMATPVATTSITIVQVAGYRFKDYLRIGGIVGLIGVISSWLSIVLIYGLL